MCGSWWWWWPKWLFQELVVHLSLPLTLPLGQQILLACHWRSWEGLVSLPLYYFSSWHEKKSEEINLRKERFVAYNLRVIQSIMAGKSCQWELKAAGDITSVIKKQRDDYCCSVHFILCIQPGTLAYRMVLPTFRFSISGSILIHIYTCVSMVILIPSNWQWRWSTIAFVICSTSLLP